MNGEQSVPTPENIIPLEAPKRLKLESVTRQRFRVIPFTNAIGTQAWRVTGIKRDGTRIRENYADKTKADCRQIALEADYRVRQPDDATLRATSLNETQIKLAEVAFTRLDSDDELLRAVEHWLRHGRQSAV